MNASTSYYLNVLGGAPGIHNTRLFADTDGNLLLPRGANVSTAAYTVPSLTFGPDSHTLIVPPSSVGSDEPTLYYALSGPSGRGIYRLKVMAEVVPRPGMYGAMTRYDKWNVVSDAGLLWLQDSELVGHGFWVAVPSEDSQGADVWQVWWLSPSGASLDTLKGHVMVNVEVAQE